jgi:ABC-type amino acid transport substrate-binding protein
MRSVGRRKGSLLVFAMLVALAAAGCGSDEPADTGAQSGGGAKVSGLITSGTLTVGTELPAPPFWIGEDYDHLTGGFEVDLAKELAKRLGLSGTKFVEMSFTGLVAGSSAPATSTSARSPSPPIAPRWSSSASRTSTPIRVSWSRRAPR